MVVTPYLTHRKFFKNFEGRCEEECKRNDCMERVGGHLKHFL